MSTPDNYSTEILREWKESAAFWRDHYPSIRTMFAPVTNALIEEAGWRGFLLPQLYLRLSTRMDTRRRLILAMFGAQVLFALMHIPNRLLDQRLALDELLLSLAFVFVLGVFFAGIYLRTGNLFLAIGVHALFNTPTVLFTPVLPSQVILGALTILVLVAWPRLTIHRLSKLGAPLRMEAT